jgi:hypothetical protein
VLPYLWTTLLAARRSPGAWALLGLGCAALSLALGLAVLALEDDRAANLELAWEGAAGVGAGVAVWVLVTTLARDATEGFALAADQCLAGPRARLLGRALGAAAAGTAASLVTLLVGVLLDPRLAPSSVYVLFTSIFTAILAAAWGLLLGGLGLGPAAAMLAALGLWLLGHFPWAAPGWEVGGGGRLLAAALPAPPRDLLGVAAALLAAIGVGGLALARADRVRRAGGSG